MDIKSHTQSPLEALTQEVTQAERELAGLYVATPKVDPHAVRQVKARLHAEASRMQLRRSVAAWLRPLTAAAASIALAAGFYATMQPIDSVSSEVGVNRSFEGLEAFAAGLPQATSDEETEIAELRSDLRLLETQTATTALDAGSSDEPSALGGRAEWTLYLADATTGPLRHQPS